MIDWEKRARELLPNTCKDPCDGDCRPHTTESARLAMLQLGREMADARAEEIAKEIMGGEAESPAELGRDMRAADISRSTISKPEPPKDDLLREQRLIQKTREQFYAKGWREGQEAERKSVACIVPPDEAAIRANEREKIAEMLKSDECLMPETRKRLVQNVLAEPKTREVVLEEALRAFVEAMDGFDDEDDELRSALAQALRALDWKPT